MKKESLGIAVGTSLALLSVIGTLASNITDATFFGTIQITNNGATAYNQTVNLTLNTTNLINSGLVNAALNNTSIKNDAGADAPYMPGLTPNPWIIFVNAITGPATNLNYTLYTGGNHTMNSTIAYFPAAAGMNTTDNASLELNSNFTINQTGFVDTTAGTNKTLVYKPGAITINITGSGNITTTIPLSTAPTFNITPDGAGVTTNITALIGAATHWQAVLTNDGDTTYVANNDTTDYEIDLYSASNQTAFSGLPITKLELFVVAKGTGGSGSIKGLIRAGGTTYTANANGLSAGYVAYSTANWTVNPNTGVAWTPSDINSLQIGVSVANGVAQESRVTQVYATITFAGTLSVTATGIASGNHSVTTIFNSPSGNFSILVDGITKDTMSLNGTLSVINTVGDWQFCVANTTPYLYRQIITINGSTQQDISWQYATIFADASGHGNSAVPTFRTSGSTSNITANMTSFQPVTQSVSTPNGTALIAQNITSSFTAPPNMFTELVISAPGASFINSILDGVGIPRALFWFPFLFGITNLLGLLVAWLTKSILIECAFMGILLVLLSLMGGFGFWVCIEYIIGASAIVVFSKQFGF